MHHKVSQYQWTAQSPKHFRSFLNNSYSSQPHNESYVLYHVSQHDPLGKHGDTVQGWQETTELVFICIRYSKGFVSIKFSFRQIHDTQTVMNEVLFLLHIYTLIISWFIYCNDNKLIMKQFMLFQCNFMSTSYVNILDKIHNLLKRSAYWNHL